MLTRDYEFLKHKYRELLLPTIFMTISGKLCLIIDIILIGFFVNSTQLSAVNLANPFIYLASVLYNLFGVGGSLLALRAKAMQDKEKSNFYFSVAIFGVILISLIYGIITFFFAKDALIIIFHTPNVVLSSALTYIQISAISFPIMCYIFVLAFFTPADGFPKLTSFAMIISNVANTILSSMFMGIFGMGVAGSAIGSVLGYIIGAICISHYFFKENHNFDLINPSKIKIIESGRALKDFVTNSPEVLGKLCYTIKITFYTALCSSYLGVIGLAAFLVYDNSETLVFMFLSGITKVTSPIVTIFYKEKDYEAVEYIINRSMRQILLIAIPFCIFFAVFPGEFARIFSITQPRYIEIITIALRVTAVGLIGRSISQLIISYTQAIEKNKISSILTFSQEFLVSIISGLILTHLFGEIGIWFAIVLSDTAPILIYLMFVIRFRRKNEDTLKGYLMIQKSNTVTYTYERGHDDIEYYVQEDTKGTLIQIGEKLGDKNPVVTKVFEEIMEEILTKNKRVDKIDITLRSIYDQLTITLTYEGDLINPIKSEQLETFKKIDSDIEYSPVLGFNRTYMNIAL